MKPKTIVIGDTEYLVDRFYLEGVKAFQSNIPWNCNPYRVGSQRADQWEYGHVNASAGEYDEN